MQRQHGETSSATGASNCLPRNRQRRCGDRAARATAAGTPPRRRRKDHLRSRGRERNPARRARRRRRAALRMPGRRRHQRARSEQVICADAPLMQTDDAGPASLPTTRTDVTSRLAVAARRPRRGDNDASGPADNLGPKVTHHWPSMRRRYIDAIYICRRVDQDAGKRARGDCRLQHATTASPLRHRRGRRRPRRPPPAARAADEPAAAAPSTATWRRRARQAHVPCGAGGRAAAARDGGSRRRARSATRRWRLRGEVRVRSV